MRLARNILRRIPTGPNPSISDYKLLLAGKLRAAWDVRVGGTFDAGRWISHEDPVSKIVLTAPTTGQRPTCVVDGSFFRGNRVIGTTNAAASKLVASGISNLVPVSTQPEIYLVARLSALDLNCNLCGFGNANADVKSGASFYYRASSEISADVGNLVFSAFSDTSAPHVFNAYLDESGTRHLLIDGVEVASASGGVGGSGVNSAATQAALGGFAAGFTGTCGAFTAAWGIVDPPMTTAERSQFTAIMRNDWGF